MISCQSITKSKYEKGIVKKRRRMTTIIGGKCADGAVLAADRKLTFFDRPTEYIEKIHLDSYPIVTAAAGGSNVYINSRNKYVAIGSGEAHAYVFLKPLYKLAMQEFARLAYFTIKYIDKFEIDMGSGLSESKPYDRPQLWFIPNSGQLYHGEERPGLIEQFDEKTNLMLDNLEKNGLNQFL
jgi:20S proteasome alpha/beta subunit